MSLEKLFKQLNGESEEHESSGSESGHESTSSPVNTNLPIQYT